MCREDAGRHARPAPSVEEHEDILGRALTDNPIDDEVTRFLRSHPEIEGVEFLVSDTNGVLRGKWAPPQSLAKAASVGVNFPLSVFGLDVWGREVADTGLHVHTGDRDGFCRIAPGSLRIVPWARRPTAQAILTMQTEAGVPFLGDPRQQLRAAIERLAALGLRAVAAFELEFYLLDPASERSDGLPAVLCGAPGPSGCPSARTSTACRTCRPTATSSPRSAPRARCRACRSTPSSRKPRPASSRSISSIAPTPSPPPTTR
ncbi:Gamma-glutamylputrescine synthetase PuuA [Methylobrevis pamukkalensis]|uniref:Gamma-glutamylputrescine synthetase PuuA n=1 Tax=Methylobrevis pamukkalensis TaxID=1439726 RepID=A0A1E3H1E2_9HYPH|nr:Gamma-glutamylputrescine synthetase PuuA [Methylobrevis pamukkalensis]